MSYAHKKPRLVLLERPQKKQKKQHPTSTRLLARRPQKKIHLAARSDRRARRASELPRNATDPARPSPRPVPHFPPQVQNTNKNPASEPRTTRLRGAIITFSFWELLCAVVALIAARRWRLACAAIDRVLARRWRRGRVVRYGARSSWDTGPRRAGSWRGSRLSI